MQDLRPCSSCRRHVAIDARTCPFCAAELAPAADRPWIVGRLSRAAAFAGITLATACWRDTAPEVQTPVVKQVGGSITGRVSEARRGQPIAGVTVHAVPRAAPTGPGFTAITDERGHYKLENLPSGSYEVTYYYLELQTTRHVEVREGVAEQVDERVNIQEPRHHEVDMPYGAPPARRRVV